MSLVVALGLIVMFLVALLVRQGASADAHHRAPRRHTGPSPVGVAGPGRGGLGASPCTDQSVRADRISHGDADHRG
jgi:hypothetical protein